MGKIPPSFRSAISTSIVSKPKTTHFSKSDSFPPKKPHPNFPKRTPKPKSAPNSLPAIRPLKTNFNSPNLSEAKTLFDSFVASPKSPNLDRNFYNSVLQSYSSLSMLQDSFSLLNHMVKTSPSFVPDHSTFHILLMKACSLPDNNVESELSLAEVHKVLDFMVNNKVIPGKATVDVAVRSLVSADRLDCAVELVTDLSSKGCLPDTYTYNFVVKSLCKGRSVSSAHSFIDKMRTGCRIKPDLVTYTILIDNVCNTRNLREATRLLGVLNEEGFRPDSFMYNTLMNGYCTLSRGSEVVDVYNKMKEQGVMPDSVTYNTMIFGLSKSGRAKDAKKYLEVMMREGHLPDVVTYTSLMNGMCREGDVLGAFRLLREMSEDNVCRPNACTYNTLLHGLCKARLSDKGMELFRVMKAGEMKLDTAAYATMVRSLCSSGMVAEAYEVFDFAVESKSLTDVAAYSTLERTLKCLKNAREQVIAA